MDQSTLDDEHFAYCYDKPRKTDFSKITDPIEREYFESCGGVPFDHWGKGCSADCPIPEHKE